MKKITNKILKGLAAAILFSLIFTGKTYSQQDLTINLMPIIPQSSYMNPAFKPTATWYIGFPMLSSVYFGLQNSFAYNDLIHVRPSDDSLVLTMNKLLGKLGKRNYLSANLMEEILAFGFKARKSYFDFSVTNKTSFRFGYPKDLIALAWQGNGQFVGKTADFSGIGINAANYNEYAVGFSRDVEIAEQKFTFGCRVKFIQGLMNVYTKPNTVNYGINSDDFGYTANESFSANMDVTDSMALKLDHLGDSSYHKGMGKINPLQMLTNFDNTGFGLDLGAAYELNKNFSFGVSVLDLGFINWKAGNGMSVRNYSSTENDFTYDGFDIASLFNLKDSATKAKTSHYLDSIGGKFQVQKSKNGYRTPLPTEINLTAIYSLTNHDKVGFLARGEFFNGAIFPSFTLSYNKWIGNMLSASVSYTMMNREYTDVGLGLAINLGAWQIYATTDNICGIFDPVGVRNMDIHFGMNFIFGYKEKKPNLSLFGGK